MPVMAHECQLLIIHTGWPSTSGQSEHPYKPYGMGFLMQLFCEPFIATRATNSSSGLAWHPPPPHLKTRI